VHGTGEEKRVEMRLESVVIPVTDVDRTKRFYRSAGFVEDFDFGSGDDFRVVQLTPPGSATSIIVGKGITAGAAGSVQGLLLVVNDIEATRAELLERGIDVGEVFHDVGGIFYHLSPSYRVLGPDPDRRNYSSFAQFTDPDGNGWVLQEAEEGALRR
jgi:catechol 2,3-dioxygenase-like lactoylglutathione lyase family enzyme